MTEGAVADIARLLDDARVSYALIGGHAVNVWLEPRFTADIDVTVQADPAAFARLREVLAAARFRVDAEHGADLASGPDFVRFGSPDRGIRLEIQEISS
ncbi:MAG: nucleotidyl transferase AbiEii/AbiGii toxin family protein [Myxococcota bacterium]